MTPPHPFLRRHPGIALAPHTLLSTSSSPTFRKIPINADHLFDTTACTACGLPSAECFWSTGNTATAEPITLEHLVKMAREIKAKLAGMPRLLAVLVRRLDWLPAKIVSDLHAVGVPVHATAIFDEGDVGLVYEDHTLIWRQAKRQWFRLSLSLRREGE